MTKKELNLRQRRWLEWLKNYNLILDYHPGKANVLDGRLFSEFCELHKNDSDLKLKRELIENCQTTEFSCLCVPNDAKLKQDILCESHSSAYSIHPGSTKMYNDLKHMYWWTGMKREIYEFLTKCLVCQQVKAEHWVPLGLLQPVMISKWK
ncbi:integrase [Gossypium australe]|uniref:Integrase n=1 Tax=Gossypium australe TaxID=47621 RepID=A0A5B6VLX4_9ROSI|nr:integrase [Gossypium australe]